VKFSDLNLHPDLAKTIADIGFTDCTPIQEDSIPIIQRGDDIAGLAQTGTGKTGAYLIPLINKILNSKYAKEATEDTRRVGFNEWRDPHFILILVPTRELAQQVEQNFETFSANTGLKSIAIYGGTSYDPQKKALKDGVQFVIATPGRLIDLFKDKCVDLHQVRAVVFDEADRMFDMGFKDDMRYLLQRIPRERQLLIFSATLNFEVTNVAYEFGSDPVEVNISKDQTTAENVKDEIFHVGDKEKAQYLLSLIKRQNAKQVIIFTNFKHKVERISRFLMDNGIPAVGISSLLSQSQRTRVMEQFKDTESKQNILVATDVAARGLDVKGVDLVINYELPDSAENYVHRIGRTGRAGEEGVAFSLVSDRDVESLSRIHEYVDRKLDIGWMESDELLKDFKRMQEFSPRSSGPKREARPRKPRNGDKKPYSKKASGSKKPYKKSENKDGDKQSSGKKKTYSKSESSYKGKKKTSKKSGSSGPKKSDAAQIKAGQKNGSVKASSKKKSASKKSKNIKYKSKYKHKSSSNSKESLGKKVSGFFKNLIS